MRLRVHPAARGLSGHYQPPGDKSISHRVALLGAVAAGQTRITGFLEAADTRATLAAMAALGADVVEDETGIVITGGRLEPPSQALDLGNSGTGMRLLAGLVAGRRDLLGERIELIGDASLSSRPMDRIIDPLAAMGANIESSGGKAPLVIVPSALKSIRYRLPVASAQVKSAVLLAGLSAAGDTVVEEPGPSRDHTERLLPAFGVSLLDGEPGIGVRGGQKLTGCQVRVPGDLSSAAFVMAATLLVPGSKVVLENVGLNPTRDGVLRIFDAMGAALRKAPGDGVGAEPVGRLEVGHARLRGIEIPAAWVPLAIDEFPVIMALAAAATGTTTIKGAAELRVKESDRLAVMCDGLRQLGVKLSETPDGAVIEGGPIRGGRVDCHGDHRIAMSLGLLGLVATGPVEVERAEWIATSYPGFVADLMALGAEVEWIDDE